MEPNLSPTAALKVAEQGIDDTFEDFWLSESAVNINIWAFYPQLAKRLFYMYTAFFME